MSLIPARAIWARTKDVCETTSTNVPQASLSLPYSLTVRSQHALPSGENTTRAIYTKTRSGVFGRKNSNRIETAHGCVNSSLAGIAKLGHFAKETVCICAEKTDLLCFAILTGSDNVHSEKIFFNHNNLRMSKKSSKFAAVFNMRECAHTRTKTYNRDAHVACRPVDESGIAVRHYGTCFAVSC